MNMRSRQNLRTRITHPYKFNNRQEKTKTKMSLELSRMLLDRFVATRKR